VLSIEDRVRYARHLLLAEIGEQGQEHLRDCPAVLEPAADEAAAAHAVDYLRRAGVRLADAPTSGSVLVRVPPAGDSEFPEADALIRGAFAAVETIKSVIGTGNAGQFSQLDSET
jgi:hypothetical protein